MLSLFKRILKVGQVTEKYNDWKPSARYRGKLRVNSSEKCLQCRLCIDACSVGALKISGSSVEIDQRNCVNCGACTAVCKPSAIVHSRKDRLAEYAGKLTQDELALKIRQQLGRSLHIRHVDAGSCNACDFEMQALLNPLYDLQQYGIDFVASPRHADLLMVTGCVTQNLTQALKMSYDAAAEPKLIMALGSCACGGNVFGETYAINKGAVDRHFPVDIYVPGCPPRPMAIIQGLLKALGRLKQA